MWKLSLLRGFTPPGSKFFRDLLHYFNLHPQDIGPNSISNIYHFQIFCEVYLQTTPTIPVFKEFFYINRQTECQNGPSQDLGGNSILRWRDNSFPSTILPSHPKGWVTTWFYCKNIAPTTENPLPGFRLSVFQWILTRQAKLSQKSIHRSFHTSPRLKLY